MSQILWISLLVVGILAFLIYLSFRSLSKPKTAAKIIYENKEHCSLILAENDNILININPDTMRHLASVVKLIVAIEFAEQVAADQIDKNELIALADLERYHIPNTDGNAHKEWLSSLEKNNKIEKESFVTLFEIAKGMIAYSSNANTEYLMDRLGIDNVNERLQKLGIKKHTAINYLVSSLYLTAELLENGTDEELHSSCNAIHEQLKTGAINAKEYDYAAMTRDYQKLINNRMTSATAREYFELLQKISNNNYFPHAVQTALTSIIEAPRSEKSTAVRFGGKGGSTLWIMNFAGYLERENGKKYEFILFSNYPTPGKGSHTSDLQLLSKSLWNFIGTITKDTAEAQKLINIINKQKK